MPLLTTAGGRDCLHSCLWISIVVNDVSLLTDVLLRDCEALSSWTLVCSVEGRTSPCCSCGRSRSCRDFLFLFLVRCGVVVSAELVEMSDIDKVDVGDVDVTHSEGGLVMTQSKGGSDMAWSVESTVTSECGCDGT